MTHIIERGRLRGRPGLATACVCALAALALIGACGQRSNGERYAAEKRLFKARTLRENLAQGGMRPEFLAGAIDAYRSIVTEYAGAAAASKEIEEIVVAAQMELAELEFRAGLLRESRGDFEKAADIARDIPPARANALFSAGAISEELGEDGAAEGYYERFRSEFLSSDSAAYAAARMNPRYLVIPLKLADFAARAGQKKNASGWYDEAESVYERIIEGEKDPRILKEARFDLLTVHLQRKNWHRGLALARELRKLYPEPRDVSSVLFIEAKIQESGLERPADARATYLSIADLYPREREAPTALLAAALIDRGARRPADARALYERVLRSCADRQSEAAEAAWQLAGMDESEGRWEEASLRYKSIYADYPETLRGFEAPLRVARAYSAKGEADAAAAAYDQALDHYQKLAGEQRRESTRIMAEEYVVRTLAERKRWREAADRLIKLPDLYPAYGPFRENYLRAASIRERELADPEGAARILEICVERYPGTELARVAENELNRLRGGKR